MVDEMPHYCCCCCYNSQSMRLPQKDFSFVFSFFPRVSAKHVDDVFPLQKKKQIYMVAWQEGRRGRGGARWLKRSQKKRCLACAPLGLSHRYRECVRERHGHSSPSSPSSVALFQGPSSNSHFIHVDLISPTDTFLFPPPFVDLVATWHSAGQRQAWSRTFETKNQQSTKTICEPKKQFCIEYQPPASK